jgi:hypothetical protein
MKKYIGAAILTLVLACCGTTALWAQVTGAPAVREGPETRTSTRQPGITGRLSTTITTATA